MALLHAGGRRHEEEIHAIYATYSTVTLMFVTFVCVTYVRVYSTTVTPTSKNFILVILSYMCYSS